MRGPLMKPLRTPDLQRRRQQQQQQQQQHGRVISLKQQIEQQHQQQLVPWNGSQPAVGNRYSPSSQGSSSSSSSSSSSRQMYGGAPSPVSPSSDASSSVDVTPFEEVAQRMLQSGGPVRRLRFSASRHSKSLVVARLPDRLKTLKQPIAITRDVPDLPPETEPHVLAAAAAAAPWRLRDSSDVQQQPGQQQQQEQHQQEQDLQQQQQQQEQQQLQQQQQHGASDGPSSDTRTQAAAAAAAAKAAAATEAAAAARAAPAAGVLDVLPVAEFLTFERTLGTQQPPPEELEQRVRAAAAAAAAVAAAAVEAIAAGVFAFACCVETAQGALAPHDRSKAQASLEAALTQRAAGLRKGSESDDDNRKNKPAKPTSNLLEDELGLERQGCCCLLLLLLLFAALKCCSLLCAAAAVCCSLLLFAAVTARAAVCCSSLLSAGATYCPLLLFVAPCYCWQLLAAASCCPLLVFPDVCFSLLALAAPCCCLLLPRRPGCMRRPNACSFGWLEIRAFFLSCFAAAAIAAAAAAVVAAGQAVTWDFEEGERSDDEGGEAPQDAKEQQEETLEAEPVETESEDDAADPLTSFGQVGLLLLLLLLLLLCSYCYCYCSLCWGVSPVSSALTVPAVPFAAAAAGALCVAGAAVKGVLLQKRHFVVFKMKSLLDKAREDEADAELHQYESDDEEEETGEEKGQEAAPAASSSTAGGPPSDLGQRTVSSTSSRGPQGPSASQQAAQSGAPQPAAGGPRETLEAKVVRVMQQHMGRMSVKDFMNAFKVKQKNEEFKRIQAVVHKVCKMEASEDKQKFIVLKPEFRL
ncbi:hypothetical protein Emed_004256 [Eimeria media]